MAKRRKETSVAIIGGGLTGLTIAAGLERKGLDYVLIESQSEPGGFIKGQSEHGIWLDYGLKSIPIPAHESIAETSLLRLKHHLNLSFGIESWTDRTLTAHKGDLVEFVGFGETKSRTLVEELSYYTRVPRVLVSGGWKNLTDELMGLIPEQKRMSLSQVTRLEVDEDNITAAVINADLVLRADAFVFTPSPKLLAALMPPHHLNPRVLQRIDRTEPFTALSLDIAVCKGITDAKNIFVFRDQVEEDFFTIGQFVTNTDPLRKSAGLQISTWLSFMDPESALDDEAVSKALRTMKKNIKKIFPSLIESPEWERLLVAPHAVGNFTQLQLENNSTVPGINNLWLSGAQLGGSERNLGRAITSALKCTEDLALFLTRAESTKTEQACLQPAEI